MSRRIIVIDDSRTVCAILEMHLQRAGYEVRCFQYPRNVIQTFFIDETPLPDLVIVDLILPKIDGYRLIQRFRQRSTSLPIVVLIRRNGTRDRLKGKLAGASDFVTKPFEVQNIVKLVQQQLKKKAVFEPNTALLQQFAASFPGHQESLVDFGVVPQDQQDREDWQAEVTRFINGLTNRGYQVWVAMFDEQSGLCPLHIVRLDRRDFQGPRPVDLFYLEWVVNQFCRPGQTTRLAGQVLEIHVLGDGQSLDELFKPKG